MLSSIRLRPRPIVRSMHQFSCPHCSTPLRVRDDTYRNRTIDCPECGEPVLVEEVQGKLTGTAVAAKRRPLPPVNDSSAAPLSQGMPPSAAKWVSLSVAALLFLGIIIYSLSSDAPVAPEPESPPAVATAPPEPQLPDDTVPSPPQATVASRLAGIHSLVAAAVGAHGVFPAELPGTPRPLRSWIAELAETQLPPVPVHWDRGWAAPVNDEFVRRRFPAFENPDIETRVSDDHYPASQFVGVAGVGADAASLPKTDPRAGIFGENRVTRLEDIKDGQTQTILIAGVEDHLGSWAKPGAATIRPFSQEPYLHGPDGFGTGQPDSMMVLMADGSVRTIDSKTDPVIVRRMAAMADGFSLDPSQPGDPLRAELPKPVPAPMPVPDPRAQLQEKPNDKLELDLRPRLQQRVLEFSQPNPTAVETLFFELQELMGMPIDLSALSPEARQTRVALKVESASLQEILDEIVRQAGLTYEIQKDRVRILPPR